MGKVLLYAGIFIIGFVGVSLFSFWLAVKPPKIQIPYTPEAFRLPAEAVTIETTDGLKLAAWFIPRRGSVEVPRTSPGANDPALILLHGYPAEKADMLPIAAALHHDFATLLLDLRYFGKSQGRFTTLGLKERDDLKRAIDFLVRRGFTEVGVFGFSLGGAVGILTAAEDERISAVAAYAPFSDLKKLGYEAYASLWILKYPLVRLMTLWARLFFGGDITRPLPAEAAQELSIPVFVIASREDEQISFSHAERLKLALAQNPDAEFYFLDRGRHGELPLDFEERLVEFFKKHLATPAS